MCEYGDIFIKYCGMLGYFLKILFFILHIKYEVYLNLCLLYISCHLRIQCCFLLFY